MTIAPISPSPGLDSEVIYGALAEAIDRAGPNREMLLLTRLALLLGCQCSSEAQFLGILNAAEHDLQSHQPASS